MALGWHVRRLIGNGYVVRLSEIFLRSCSNAPYGIISLNFFWYLDKTVFSEYKFPSIMTFMDGLHNIMYNVIEYDMMLNCTEQLLAVVGIIL